MAPGLSGLEFEAQGCLAPIGLKTPENIPQITRIRPSNKKNAPRCGFLPTDKRKSNRLLAESDDASFRDDGVETFVVRLGENAGHP
jgi:hypothetical protein